MWAKMNGEEELKNMMREKVGFFGGKELTKR